MPKTNVIKACDALSIDRYLKGEQFLRPDLGGVHGVEVILIFVIGVHRLDVEPPLREAS